LLVSAPLDVYEYLRRQCLRIREGRS